jgi:DNA primase
VNRRPPDPNSVPTLAERRRLLEVHRAAARFFRRELLRATDGWAGGYLVRGGAGELLASDSGWAVGYAPDAPSRLVEHLRAKGFDLASVRNAGLGLMNPEGRTWRVAPAPTACWLTRHAER